MKEILLKYCTKYTKMQVQDAVKLLYQSEFGGGHMIDDPEKSLERIHEEARKNAAVKEEYCEKIGDGTCRMNLSVLEDGLRPETLNQMFVWTANRKKGTVEGVEQKLAELLALCEMKELPFEAEEVREYLAAYKAQGYPPVSHSEIYREQYHPSYRVVHEEFARYYRVFLEIDRMLGSRTIVAAIDGMCGAGKTTLGKLLQEIYACNLFHMDDFFLRPEQRTPERLKEPGGNVDYERFQEQILNHTSDSEGLTYQVFQCKKRALDERITVPYNRLNIVEGSYSQHPYFGDVYDLRFFCGIEPEEQIRRIEKRSGTAMLEMFRSTWIPMENRYLETFKIQEKSIAV
ncbi:MAG: hypothetical protein ACI39W_08960 [Brotaphodocola sp.]